MGKMKEKLNEQLHKESEEFYKKINDHFHWELVPLNHEEAIIELKKGRYLENGVDPAHEIQYKWDGKNVVTFNAWEYNFGGGVIVAIEEIPQLYKEMYKRRADGKLFEWAEVSEQLFGY